GRNGIGIELQQDVAEMAEQNLEKDRGLFTGKTSQEIIVGDSSNLNLRPVLNKNGISSVQLIIMHPPYWDIIKYSDDPRDLSK
ncbi:hypothetical protein J0675_25990, partial [Vibrio parahaemolyticus]